MITRHTICSANGDRRWARSQLFPAGTFLTRARPTRKSSSTSTLPFAKPLETRRYSRLQHGGPSHCGLVRIPANRRRHQRTKLGAHSPHGRQHPRLSPAATQHLLRAGCGLCGHHSRHSHGSATANGSTSSHEVAPRSLSRPRQRRLATSRKLLSKKRSRLRRPTHPAAAHSTGSAIQPRRIGSLKTTAVRRQASTTTGMAMREAVHSPSRKKILYFVAD